MNQSSKSKENNDLIVYRTVEGAINAIPIDTLKNVLNTDQYRYTGSIKKFYENGKLHKILHFKEGKLIIQEYFANNPKNILERKVTNDHEYIYGYQGDLIAEYKILNGKKYIVSYDNSKLKLQLAWV